MLQLVYYLFQVFFQHNICFFDFQHLSVCTVVISEKKLKNILICLKLIYCKTKYKRSKNWELQQIACPFFSLSSLPLSLCLCPNSSDKAASLLRIKRKKFPLKFKVKINPKLHFEKRERERGKKRKRIEFF